VGFFLWSFLPSANSVENPLLSQRGLMAWIGQYYFPLTWFVNGVSHSSFTDFLWVALTNGTVFVTFIFIAQSLFAKTNQQSLITVIAKYKKQYITKSQSVFWTLVIKEFRKLISTSLYAFNAAFGLVLMVLLAVVSLFSKTYLESMMVELAAVGLSPSIFILGFIGFCVAMSYSPAISLSLEGKNLWRLKSLPISAKTIMWSKILFNTFLVIPFAFLSWILFAISFNITIIDLLAILFLSVSFIFLSSVMDGVINLLFPRFDFVNDIEIIKTSLGALLGVFGGFGLMIINGVIFYFINPLLGSTLSYVCLGLIDAGLAFLASLYIEKKSEERFRTF
jgi:ABC-2 type transport system permease protein